MLLLLLASCGSSHKVQKSSEQTVAQEISLTPEQQRKYDYFLLEAFRLNKKQEHTAAFDLLKHCLDINPTGAEALHQIAQYYLYLGEVTKGQEALKKAIAYAPDNYWYAYVLAGTYLKQDQKDEAIEIFEKMASHFPTKQNPLLSLLDLYNQKEDYDKVISTLNRIEKMRGKSEQISMEKFRIYLQMKDEKKAFEEIESLVNEYPMDYHYQVILGDVYMQNGRNQEAYNTYKKVLAAEPDNLMALLSLTSYYEQTGQKELFKQQMDTLLLNRKIPSDVKVDVMRQFIVKNEQEVKDSTQIIGLFDKMMQVNEVDDVQIPMLYAQYLLFKKMDAQSVPVFEHIIKVDPTNTAARMTLLGFAFNKKNYEQMIEICKSGIEATPGELNFYYYLAIAYSQVERLDNVLEVTQKALEHITPESDKKMVSDIYLIMGDVYHTKESMEKAFAAYDSALVYNPSNMDVLNNYAYYLSVERRDLDKAEEMSYKTVKADPNNATCLDTYAWILFEKGNYAEARIYIDDAIKNTKPEEESSVVFEHCGDIYFMTGDVEGALKYWKKALELGTESKTLKQKIEKKKYIAQ